MFFVLFVAFCEEWKRWPTIPRYFFPFSLLEGSGSKDADGRAHRTLAAKSSFHETMNATRWTVAKPRQPVAEAATTCGTGRPKTNNRKVTR